MPGIDLLALTFKFGTPAHLSTTDLVAVSYIMELLRDSRLDLCPDYQRDFVWKTEDKSKYVSAVIGGAPAGQIVIVRDGNCWKIIDGKQRVDSFSVFFAGGCAAVDRDGVRFSWKPRRGCQTVPESEREAILKKQFVVVRFNNLSDHHQRQIFQGLQQGRRLTTGQRLHGALNSPRKQLSDTCLEMYRKRFADDLGFSRNRGAEFELLVIQSVHMLLSQHRSFLSVQPLLKWLSNPERVTQRSRDRVWECFQLMFSALVLPEARLLDEDAGEYSLSPVEIVLAVLFSEDMIIARREHEKKPLASAIRELRQQSRRRFAGVMRCNDSVLKHGIKFIRTWLRSRPSLAMKNDESVLAQKTVEPIAEGRAAGNKQPRKRLPLPPADEIIDLTGDGY